MKIKKWNQAAAAEAEEEEDALSLCDLPIYSDVSEWEKFSAGESQSSSSMSSSSSSKSEFFEFFSEEWKKPATSNLPPEKIIFCGKLIIPPKDPVEPENDEKWRKNKRGNLTETMRRKSSRRKDCCDGEAAEESNNKALALRESSSPLLRSRWFVFLFGMDNGRFPKQMDLKDMKNRQSRKTTAASSPVPQAGNRLRGMIRALSCGDSHGQVHAHAIVKASIALAL